MSATGDTYDLTAATALEALNVLEAARNIIEAHLTLGLPNSAFVPNAQRAEIRVQLGLHLDLTGLLQQINQPTTLGV